MYEEVREHLKEMLEIGAIQPSHRHSPVILVCKKVMVIGLTFFIDMKNLKYNACTIKDSYSLPRIEDILDRLNGAVWFTALDLKLGYWQVEMDEASKPLKPFNL